MKPPSWRLNVSPSAITVNHRSCTLFHNLAILHLIPLFSPSQLLTSQGFPSHGKAVAPSSHPVTIYKYSGPLMSLPLSLSFFYVTFSVYWFILYIYNFHYFYFYRFTSLVAIAVKYYRKLHNDTSWIYIYKKLFSFLRYSRSSSWWNVG